ncbi:MFS transporter [Motilimonas eburnea]|uniref:MFS transporter n=1 Tax=Motilimonas eburnea TaxID=1737488 RepID=UPI001E2E4976|nr:MFS transporter [Motilimonas eburnea]MCE2570250.1 MFS transporter [Motilimonas eburnea]
MNLNLALLIAMQILFMVGNMMFVTLAPVLGNQLAGTMSLATLPMAVSMLSMLVSSFPLSMAMGRFGRKPLFASGLIANCLAGCGFYLALRWASFELFILASVGFGFAISCANFYRFSAMELVAPAQRPLAISGIMAAGVVAAFIGPNLGALTKDIWLSPSFSTSVLLYIPLTVLSLLLLMNIRFPAPASISNAASTKLPINQIWRPIFTAAVAFAVMVMVMTATPLHMFACGFEFSDSAWVIQWHVLGMFAPSFFVSQLVKRIGLKGLMSAGAVILIASALLNLNVSSKTGLTLGLVLLGVGWNFLFVGASQWLMALCENQNSAKIQGVNEVCVFGLATLATLSSGWLLDTFGWETLNITVLPLLLLLLGLLLTVKPKHLTAVS